MFAGNIGEVAAQTGGAAEQSAVGTKHIVATSGYTVTRVMREVVEVVEVAPSGAAAATNGTAQAARIKKRTDMKASLTAFMPHI